MKAKEIIETLDAVVYYGSCGCGCDLMSDVLAFNHDNNVLLTGAVNPQAIRTCEVVDTKVVVFVRSKKPAEEVIELAESAGIILLGTHFSMFEACGRLYEAGLRGESIEYDF